jgi:hypothetical protein|tara:strand:+ start:693 stop:1064 length:372 start_codon:yes stop_codon:yes gene_type:complete
MSNCNEQELYELVEKSIDLAMQEHKFLFRMYPYLKANKWTRREVNLFIESATASNLNFIILELEGYIKGGDKTLREAYGHIPKPKARKIKDYLYGILEDAWKYHAERKPGRKPGSKNRKRLTK